MLTQCGKARKGTSSLIALAHVRRRCLVKAGYHVCIVAWLEQALPLVCRCEDRVGVSSVHCVHQAHLERQIPGQ